MSRPYWFSRPYVVDEQTACLVDADYEFLTINEGGDETADAIRQRRTSRIFINNSEWIAANGIGFLGAHADCITHLTVADFTIRDWSPISQLVSLTHLSVGSGLAEVKDIAFRNLPNLRTLGWGSTRVGAVPEATGLTELRLFRTKLDDLQELRTLSELTELSLLETSIKCLSGADTFENLRRLDVTRGQIKSLAPLAGSTLRELHLTLCSKLEDYEALPSMRRLERLTVDGCKKILPNIDLLGRIPNLKRLLLDNLGSVESLDFLRPGKALELVTWSGDVRIKDGQMGVLLKLPSLKHVEFPDRRHHSHRWIEIVRELEKRSGLRFAQGRFQRIEDLVPEDSDAH